MSAETLPRWPHETRAWVAGRVLLAVLMVRNAWWVALGLLCGLALADYAVVRREREAYREAQRVAHLRRVTRREE